MPTQKARLLILLLYVTFLFIVNYFAFGVFIPSSGGHGLWFYAGMLSILLGNLIVTPYFTKPVDALVTCPQNIYHFSVEI